MVQSISSPVAGPMNPRTHKIPSIKTGVNLYSLPLSSSDGFILSCIDGTVSVEDISSISGIDLERISETIRRLDKLGAITWSDAIQVPSPEPLNTRDPIKLKSHPTIVTLGQTRLSEDEGRATSPGPEGKKQRADAPKANDDKTPNKEPIKPVDRLSVERTSRQPEGSTEEVDLPPDKRKLILDAYRNLEYQTLYQSLDLPQNATREQIRTAYFNLSKVFHPDSAYGQRLGGFKSKMEAVFKRITEAYDVLGKKARRQEYDEYLAATAQTTEAQEALDRGVREAQVLGQAEYEEPAQRSSTSSTGAVRRDSVSCETEGKPTTDETTRRGERGTDSSSGRVSMPPSTPEERRQRTQQLLRRRLEGATGRPPTPGAGTSISGRPSTDRQSVPDDSPESAIRRDRALRGLATSLKGAAMANRGQRSQQQTAYAKEFESKGNLIEAANCLRLAATFEPDRADIRAEYQRVSALVAADLAQRYEKRAQYEERAGKWKVAAESWSKVSEGRLNEAYPARKTAEMLLKAGEDVVLAKKYAERAVELDPRNVSNITLLAAIYIAGGLVLNAKRELEKANKLDPGNEVVKNLLKDLR
jgi:curved DNA-binding protein CbpA